MRRALRATRTKLLVTKGPGQPAATATTVLRRRLPTFPSSPRPRSKTPASPARGYRQETYYTCNTVAGSAHCGWHLPLVKAPKAGGGAAALQSVGGAAAETGAVVAAVACLAGVFALAMV